MTGLIGALTGLVLISAICFYFIQPKIIELINSVEELEVEDIVIIKKTDDKK